MPVTLNVEVADQPGLAYQWFKDGEALSGADTETVLIDSISAADEGDYSVVVSNANGAVLEGPIRVRMVRESLFNISTRGFVGSNSEKMIAGFILSGTQTRQVLIRGLGKSLEKSGIAAFLQNPRLELFNIEGQEIKAG